MIIDWLIAKAAWLLAAALIAMAAVAGVQTVRLTQEESRYNQLEMTTAIANEGRAKQYAADLEQAREVSDKLADEVDKTRLEKNEAVKRLDHRVAGLLGELRNRPERPAAAVGANAQDTSAGSSGTGAGLYRPDAEFLVGEAASAAHIGLERDACYSQYQRVRQALNPEGSAQ